MAREILEVSDVDAEDDILRIETHGETVIRFIIGIEGEDDAPYIDVSKEDAAAIVAFLSKRTAPQLPPYLHNHRTPVSRGGVMDQPLVIHHTDDQPANPPYFEPDGILR